MRYNARVNPLQDQPLVGPNVWRGRELFARQDWEVRLSDADVRELVDAAARASHVPADELTIGDFVLPTLAARLARVQHDLEHGCGAARILGLGPDAIAALDPATLARVFVGLCLHIGTPVSQSATGETLLDVRDRSFGADDPRVRGPHTNKALRFHTDRCDVIAFLCVRPAESGGENELLSSAALYNELLRHHPSELRVLAEPFPYLRHTVDRGNARAYTRMPVFSFHDGHFAASLLRVLIDRADASPDAPDLTNEQRDALDTLERVAEDPKLVARFRQAPGDVLLVNNWVTLHRRAAFGDAPDAALRRHLLRLWLAVPNSRPLSPAFREHFGRTEAGVVRGGMRPYLPGSQ